MAMPEIDFDRTIETDLTPRRLWELMVGAFENPATSPVWPVDLEEVDPVKLKAGQTVEGVYKLGPIKSRLSYHITDFDPPRAFSYRSDDDHPLAGGATVEVQHRRAGTSALRWHGHYKTRLHLKAPAAYLFVRFYFLDTFFGRLEANLQKVAPGRPSQGDQPISTGN